MEAGWPWSPHGRLIVSCWSHGGFVVMVAVILVVVVVGVCLVVLVVVMVVAVLYHLLGRLVDR